jgi:signal recognition particle subunit SRP54
LKERGRKPLLVAADLQRPAAVDQLKVIGEQLGIPVYSEAIKEPLTVCRNAVSHARLQSFDTVILDTAGRLHIAEMPMDELKAIDRQVKPDQVYLVCDAMTGQDAVNSSKAFNDALELNGVILTKLDGDARGGAALSIKEVTHVPIKWIGVGEKLDRLEEFHPDRMAQRILGQGDLMSLVEHVSRVQSQIDQETLKKQQEKLAKGDFTLNDFRAQFDQLRKMDMRQVMGMMPGMDGMLEGIDEDPEGAFRRFQGMIDSMTPEEKRNPDLIDLSRRRRIATGSGCEPHEVKKFIEQFEVVRRLMRQMLSMSMWQKMKMLTGLNKAGAFLPGSGLLQKVKGDTGHRKTAKERAEERKKKRRRGR